MDITDYGSVTIELVDDQTPVTVANFLEYVDLDFYDGLIFHRVIDSFMIQGVGRKHVCAQAWRAWMQVVTDDSSFLCTLYT